MLLKRVKNRTVFPIVIWWLLRFRTVLHGTCQPKEWVVVMQLGWGEIVISTENRAFFQSFCPISFFYLIFLYLCFHIEKHG